MSRSCLIILLLSPALPHSAQDTSLLDKYLEEEIRERPFEQEAWEETKKELDFPLDILDEADEKPEEKEQPRPGKEVKNPQFWSDLIRLTGFLALAAILGFLLVRMFGSGKFFRPRNKKISSPGDLEVDIEQIRENLPDTDLENLISQQIQTGSYNVAIRLYYLAVIRELVQKGHLRWKKDKTNAAFLKELEGGPYYIPFQELTLQFERSWYGEREVGLSTFTDVENEFKALLKRLK